MLHIQPLGTSDLEPLCHIWNSAFGPEWPMTERLLRQTISDSYFEPDGLLGAFEAGTLVGWVLCKSMRGAGAEWGSLQNRGGIGALCVHPNWQRRGVGTALLKLAEAHLTVNGSSRSLLYVPHHLLPGVPTDCSNARLFFEKHGTNFKGAEVFDMWRDLSDYAVPAKVSAALQRQPGVDIRPAREEESAAVRKMVEREFPGGWSYTVERHFRSGLPARDIVVAVEGDEVLGFCFIADRQSQWLLPSTYWHPLLGDYYGGLGPIGMAQAQRGRGLGLALVAIAVGELQRRGVREMVIDWTGLTDFYGQLGFQVWKRYQVESPGSDG